MCTAATYKTKDFYFGRTLDYEFSYGDEIAITPRKYTFDLRHARSISNHYAIIGMAHVEGEYPLYYDAINEKGIGMAGLNFVGNAFYESASSDTQLTKIAQFEFIPYILSQCNSVEAAKRLMMNITLVDTAFSDRLPVSPLHWIIADEKQSITVEATRDGMHIYENPIGVLTNNPPFPYQMAALQNYRGLSAGQSENTFAKGLELGAYSRGMGAIGLPGDLSSQSRFIRAAFTKLNSRSADTEKESVSQFFHILGSVCQQRGCCEVDKGKYEITLYTSCCNAGKGIYYYTTYDNSQITGVDMHRENLDTEELIVYPVKTDGEICMMN